MNRNSGGGLVLLFALLVCLAGSAFLLAGPRPWLVLAVPLLLPLLGVTAKWPHIGFFIMVALVPLDSWRVLSEEYPFLTVSKFIGAWLVVVVVVRMALEPHLVERLRSRIWVPLLLFLLVFFLASLYCMPGKFLFCLNQIRRLLTALVFVALTLFLLDDRRFRRGLPTVIIASTTLASLVAIVGHFLQIPSLVMSAASVRVGGRVVGTASDPNFFAAMVLCALPILAHCILFTPRGRSRFFYAALFAINTYAIVLTYSRGVMLALGVTLILLIVEHLRHLRVRHIGFVVLAGGIILGVAGYKLPKTAIWERMATIFHPRMDESIKGRATYLVVAKDIVKRHPVLGSGPGTFPFHYAKSNYASMFAREHTPIAYQRAAHNTYVEVAVGTGFVGFALFSFLILMTFWYFYRAQAILSERDGRMASYIRALAIGFVALLVSFMFLSDIYHKYIWMFIGLAAIAMQAAERRRARA